MSRRRPNKEAGGHQRWLISYADFITLLFALFVMMYSSAQVDQRRVGKLAMAIQTAFQQLGAFPAGGGSGAGYAVQAGAQNGLEGLAGAAGQGTPKDDELAALRRELEAALAPELAREEVEVRQQPDGLVLSLREVGFFESGSAAMRETSKGALDQVAQLLSARDYRLRIEGHTDNVPIHNAKVADNWALSTARATELVRLLVQDYGFQPERLASSGYAEFHPVASNQTAEGRARNRRVDVVILDRKTRAEQSEPEGQTP
jgi:chemotaxis protein MotB